MTQYQKGQTFKVGEIVSLCADPTATGAVIEVLPGAPEYRYRLFINGTTSLYYASQLQPCSTKDISAALLPLSEFQARLTALQIQQPSLSKLYSLHAARINFVPYQFRPVLRFIRADRPRLLIADEVGVGKTIEAGLILRELQARRDIRSVLILCPKPLVVERKWQLEMQRFDEDFYHLDGPMLRHCLRETESFQYMAAPNPFIHHAVNVVRAAVADWQTQAHQALLTAGETAWGKIMLHGNADYHQLCEQTAGDTLSSQERLAFIRHAENLQTFANLISGIYTPTTYAA